MIKQKINQRQAKSEEKTDVTTNQKKEEKSLIRIK